MPADRTAILVRHLTHATCQPWPDGPTDGRLLVRFLDDQDEDAFTEIVCRHGPMVLGVCRRVLADTHAAEDAFQATFLVLAKKARTLTETERVGGWLYGVARRAALKARAAAARRRVREAAAARPVAVGSEDDPSELLAMIEQELGRLPDRYRGPLLLCGLEGRPRAEIAGLLGIPEGTLASRLATARILLAKRLRRRGVVVPAGLFGGAATVVPPAVAASTARAAAVVAGFAAGTVPAAVRELITKVSLTMLLTKFRLGLLAVPAAMLLVAGTTLLAGTGEMPAARCLDDGVGPAPPSSGRKTDTRPPDKKREAEVKTDRAAEVERVLSPAEAARSLQSQLRPVTVRLRVLAVEKRAGTMVLATDAMMEGRDRFEVELSPATVAALARIGVSDLAGHFVGRDVEVRGRVERTSVWIEPVYVISAIRVESLDQILAVR